MPEHVLKALEVLQFSSYIPEARQIWEQQKQVFHSQIFVHLKEPKSRKKEPPVGIPPEQLAREQQQLFEKARLALEAQEKLKQQPSKSGNSNPM